VRLKGGSGSLRRHFITGGGQRIVTSVVNMLVCCVTVQHDEITMPCLHPPAGNARQQQGSSEDRESAAATQPRNVGRT